MMNLKIGNVVTLTTSILGNNPGTRGVVFNTYTDFDDNTKEGVSIIFENGEYDGFSYEEQKIFLQLEDVKFIPFYIREYKFSNVIKLSRDFENGLWDDIFN